MIFLRDWRDKGVERGNVGAVVPSGDKLVRTPGKREQLDATGRAASSGKLVLFVLAVNGPF